VTDTPKATAVDWNSLAWFTLYTGEISDRDLEAANTAMRMTQSRNPGIVHTLGCLKAMRGDTAGARKLLSQYLDTQDDFNDSARLLLGLILEHLELPEAARGMYEKLTPPKTDSPTSSYDLAQRRLGAMRAPITR
jgi:hypothetical protein